jgi:hypothetical protein
MKIRNARMKIIVDCLELTFDRLQITFNYLKD